MWPRDRETWGAHLLGPIFLKDFPLEGNTGYCIYTAAPAVNFLLSFFHPAVDQYPVPDVNMLSSHGCNQAKEQLVHILLTSSINSCLLLKAVCPGCCSNSKQWEGSGNFPTNFMPNLLSVLSGCLAQLRRKTLLLCSQESASLFAVPDHPDQPAPKWSA